MNRVVRGVMVLGQIMDLCVAVMARGNAIVGMGGQYLIQLEPAILTPRIVIPRLQEATTAAAAVVVGSVRYHIDEIFFSHQSFDHKPQVIGYRVAVTLSYNLAGVLNCKLDL